MQLFRNRRARRVVFAITATAGMIGLPILGTDSVSAAAGDPQYFKVIVNYVGEQVATDNTGVGITVDGTAVTNLFAIDIDSNPNTLNIVSEPLLLNLGQSGRTIAFSETNGSVNLADYTTTSSCNEHYKVIDPTWDDATHSGSLFVFPVIRYDCFITNTRKPANLTLTNVATESSIAPGAVVHYTISAKNTGSSTATNVALTTDKSATVSSCTIGVAAATNPAPTLAPGKTLVCKASYTVPATVTGAAVVNTATVTSPSDSTLPSPAASTVTIDYPVVASLVAPPVIPPLLNAVTPVRLFDTRVGEAQGLISVTKKVYGGAVELKVKVTGVGGVPETGASAISLNVTAVNPAGTGFVTVYPCGTRPGVSSLNYTAGQIVANAVIAPVSAAGEICLYSSVDTNLIGDLNSWIATAAGFVATTPARLVDTRSGEAQGLIPVTKKLYGGGGELQIRVAGVGGIPVTATAAVSLNVTAVGPAGTGFVTAYPCGTRPGVSSLNYTAGQIVANAVIAPLSAAGDICLYSSVDTNLLIDVNGSFATGSSFNSLTPARLVDTRIGESQGLIAVTKKVYGGATELRVKVTAIAGVPSAGVAALSLNVTAVDPVGTGYVTVYPCGTRPGVSNLNYTAGQIVANAVITPISATGDICLYSSVDTNLLIDINSWFAMGSA